MEKKGPRFFFSWPRLLSSFLGQHLKVWFQLSTYVGDRSWCVDTVGTQHLKWPGDLRWWDNFMMTLFRISLENWWLVQMTFPFQNGLVFRGHVHFRTSCHFFASLLGLVFHAWACLCHRATFQVANMDMATITDVGGQVGKVGCWGNSQASGFRSSYPSSRRQNNLLSKISVLKPAEDPVAPPSFLHCSCLYSLQESM